MPAHTRPGLVHFALAVGGFAIGTTEFAAMSLLRYFARDLHIDEPTAGHVISSYALGAVVGAPIIAVLSAHVTRRPLLMGLMGVFALGNLLSALALVFSVFGVGMTVGNLVVPRFADRALMRTAGMLLAGSALVLVIYPFAAANFWTVTADVFLLGVGGALATVLQTRLMDVAGEAQSLDAALNHSAFNVANALGPWLGGLAIAAGFGLTSIGFVGCALAIGGLAVWGISRARSA